MLLAAGNRTEITQLLPRLPAMPAIRRELPKVSLVHWFRRPRIR
nr:hypothetical protein [uncultured Actinoplanes sp.]